MTNIFQTLALIGHFLSYVPPWLWASAIITIVHTYEETTGPIWDELSVPAALYFVFQAFVLGLGTYAILNMDSLAVWMFVAIRIGDAIVTHAILRKSGWVTAPLLVVDACVVVALAQGF